MPNDVLAAGSGLFKAGMRRLTGGVAIVTARGSDGSLVGMTVTSVCSLTAEPPMLLVCANKTGSFASHAQRGAAFCVNLLSADDEEVARACAGMTSQSREDRFDGEHWRTGADGTPILLTALARFHCVVSDLVPASTHLLTIGRVWDVHLGHSGGAALAYREGQFIKVQ
ncbi:flavin reductase family protein [Bradyrhizobium jicamae]|uniref:flavin reductase family protein n=1 Tax=Bradyrhizobium jicamae TaxID=280332 RepID=UPI001BA9B026|nr:flavin reductase family protein [Bradyrhizobium jicamae]MBR0751281.1 flavin reductase family protein [Bradyrhizobium jicamae]